MGVALWVLVGALPCRADPVSWWDDDAEYEAGLSLDQTLAGIQAEREVVMRAHQVERARLLQLMARRPRPGPLPVEAMAQEAVAWLAGQGDPTQTTIPVVPGREGLLVSFDIPATDPLAGILKGRAYSYDTAVAVSAFLIQGQTARARAAVAALARLVGPDGQIGFSYQVDRTDLDPQVRTGTLAEVGYALAFYQRATGDATSQATAERIAGYLNTLQLPSGSLKGGPSVTWASTEHNLRAYFFYRELGRVTGRTDHRATAEQIKHSLLTNHWIKERKGGHFLRGIGDPTPTLDVNALGTVFLWAIGRSDLATQAFKYVESTFKTQQTIPGSSTRITGYAPDNRRGTIWFEGTLGVAMAYQRLGKTKQAGALLQGIAALRTAWQSQGRWRGAVPYALPRYVNVDGDTMGEWGSVASTSWLALHLALRRGEGRFWDRD